tara:strand:+ start:4770 stop:4910 length:141 start_codon:yes stop_codon:yes gene_type:complete
MAKKPLNDISQYKHQSNGTQQAPYRFYLRFMEEEEKDTFSSKISMS